jgi:hypothetical protein
MKCDSCRKIELEVTTWWERFKYQLMLKMFPVELQEYFEEKYTKGFGDGYKIGMEHAELNHIELTSLNQPNYEIKDLFQNKEILESKVEKVFGNKDFGS